MGLGGSLEGVGRLSGGCGEDVWRVWGAVCRLWVCCLTCVGRLCGGSGRLSGGCIEVV